MNEEDSIGGSAAHKPEAFKTRWFFAVFFGAVFLSVFATFYRVFIARSYLVTIETKCDPKTEACFARSICDTEDQSCGEGDTPTGTSYYKTVERKASSFPAECASGSLESDVCADLSCRPGEASCTETLCSGEVVPKGESCAGPGVVPEEPSAQKEEHVAGDENSGTGESASGSQNSGSTGGEGAGNAGN